VGVTALIKGRRSSLRKRKVSDAESEKATDDEEYVVEELIKMRINSNGNKQVLVRWEGYRKCTWEPYESMHLQLPEMLLLLETSSPRAAVGNDEQVDAFLASYVASSNINASYRWTPERLAAFEHTVSLQNPPLRVTNYRLRQRLKALLI
jgi:hypothetical protein